MAHVCVRPLPFTRRTEAFSQSSINTGLYVNMSLFALVNFSAPISEESEEKNRGSERIVYMLKKKKKSNARDDQSNSGRCHQSSGRKTSECGGATREKQLYS